MSEVIYITYLPVLYFVYLLNAMALSVNLNQWCHMTNTHKISYLGSVAEGDPPALLPILQGIRRDLCLGLLAENARIYYR